jgi:hypothetical protein
LPLHTSSHSATTKNDFRLRAFSDIKNEASR